MAAVRFSSDDLRSIILLSGQHAGRLPGRVVLPLGTARTYVPSLALRSISFLHGFKVTRRCSVSHLSFFLLFSFHPLKLSNSLCYVLLDFSLSPFWYMHA